MKFISVHLKLNNDVFAVNPLQISAFKPLKEGGTRIYYTLLSQHDDITEDYDTVLMKFNGLMKAGESDGT